jgi:hypothetical protein
MEELRQTKTLDKFASADDRLMGLCPAGTAFQELVTKGDREHRCTSCGNYGGYGRIDDVAWSGQRKGDRAVPRRKATGHEWARANSFPFRECFFRAFLPLIICQNIRHFISPYLVLDNCRPIAVELIR